MPGIDKGSPAPQTTSRHARRTAECGLSVNLPKYGNVPVRLSVSCCSVCRAVHSATAEGGVASIAQSAGKSKESQASSVSHPRLLNVLPCHPLTAVLPVCRTTQKPKKEKAEGEDGQDGEEEEQEEEDEEEEDEGEPMPLYAKLGIRLDKRDRSGVTALHLAVKQGAHLSLPHARTNCDVTQVVCRPCTYVSVVRRNGFAAPPKLGWLAHLTPVVPYLQASSRALRCSSKQALTSSTRCRCARCRPLLRGRLPHSGAAPVCTTSLSHTSPALTSRARPASARRALRSSTSPSPAAASPPLRRSPPSQTRWRAHAPLS